MQLADSPRKIALAFAENGEKDIIPEDSSPSVGRASMNDGFPPETRQPVGSGGIPPSGLDMNGILYYLSLLNRWQSAGAGFVYDSVFANDADVGGYPKGAILLRSDADGFWLNLVDNNLTDPDTGGANWQPINNVGITSKTLAGVDVTLTNNEAAKDIIVLSGTLTANVNLIVPVFVKQWIVANNTTGAFTVTVKTASGTGGLVTQNTSRILYGDGVNIYGVNALAATQAQVDAGADTQTFLTPKTFKDSSQLADKADKNGSSLNTFDVLTASTPTQAITKAQFDAKTGISTTTVAGIVEKATLAELVTGLANVWPDAETLLTGFDDQGTSMDLPDFLGNYGIRWGETTASVAGEGTISVTFSKDFPTSCLHASAIYLNSGASSSGTEDMWTQLVSSDTHGAVFYLQSHIAQPTQDRTIRWFAIGR